MIYYDNATVEIDYNGRKKTFSLCKINKESVSKEISEVKGIENADGNLNKDVVLSEYLLEIHDIIHRRY